MNIKIETEVKGNYLEVMEQFDLKLFEALKPKGVDMEIIEFTGSKKGDKVHIRFRSPIKAEWISLITEDGHNENEAWFVDEGDTLPFPLSYWKHKHIVRKLSDTTSMIVDDITFEGSNKLMSALIYPGIYTGFYPRKKIYKRFFETMG